jgi:hypothetical protein
VREHNAYRFSFCGEEKKKEQLEGLDLDGVI